MGFNSLDEQTVGYMQNGDIPTFLVYDTSENIISLILEKYGLMSIKEMIS